MMTKPLHYVIIGSGSAGFGAAKTLREGDKQSRITMITMDALPFYNRYDLPDVFRGKHDWHKLLAVPPSTYEEMRIELRRLSRVVDVDGPNKLVSLAHQEQVAYDRLLVCAGGRSYLPENLIEFAPLMHGFGTFEAAMRLYNDLPKGGTVIMIGGDMIGLDLACTLIDTGYKVVLITNAQTFWPHELTDKEKAPLLKALEKKGVKVHRDQRPVGVTETRNGKGARCVTFEDGAEVCGDVVMSFCGLSSSIEFMLKADVDIERGLLVTPELQTSNPTIWAAGDICQIWHDAEKAYKFCHGWQNVRLMGELAARNMLGAHEPFDAIGEDEIGVGADGQITSTFWTH
jgi:NAD(P)H-nitrite reductase large subunit